MTTLVIRGGHLIDPSAGVDALKDILLKDGAWPRSPRPASSSLPTAPKCWMQPASPSRPAS